jgi:sensor c-di-GMP phosphodiesterase-like protein
MDMNTRLTADQSKLASIERQSLENGLRHAVERHELVLHYQPKVNLESNTTIGVEALIRWHHPQRGVGPPAQFNHSGPSSHCLLCAAGVSHRA